MRRTSLPVAALATMAAAALALTGCSASQDDAVASASADGPALVIISSDFVDDGALPASASTTAYDGQCDGPNTSPALAWADPPAGTVAYVLTITDTDADGFVHAIVEDVSVDLTGAGSGAWDDLGVNGTNDGGTVGYFGPCPPSGTHHYVFTIDALDTTLGLDKGFTYDEAQAAMDGHVLASASITGTVVAAG
ncbi:YbhB/YbcL family Raf kinase inhibitor-like protein [Demequina salsinemoris]|uniref:YbhB/YbcL family Raf kinase inhibitor-like protein n=1 Tax=Demequina salsinemoris TaxID=577470 RepID=UPI000784B986|nr:YbhB/YbcL family Raf kinase inhibitor-like protein [Demequina salsinemoris]